MIVIPDIHGRTFWKDAVMGRENEEIIFLGDYVDPYCSLEDVAIEDGLKSLEEVICFKKQYPDNVVLLLGNHDLSYISSYITKCRHDYLNHDAIRNLILENISLFQIAYEKHIGAETFIFSHAGILPDWLENNEDILGKITLENEVEELNKIFHAKKLYKALGNISFYRGGNQMVGSCIWADIDEHFDYMELETDINSNVYQIFGHTLQLTEQPVITDLFACLDCRHAFILDDEGNLTQI